MLFTHERIVYLFLFRGFVKLYFNKLLSDIYMCNFPAKSKFI